MTGNDFPTGPIKIGTEWTSKFNDVFVWNGQQWITKEQWDEDNRSS